MTSHVQCFMSFRFVTARCQTDHLKYGDVSRQQLVSGARNLNSPATLLPKTFLKENFIKINSTNLQDFTRDKVQKLKVY